MMFFEKCILRRLDNIVNKMDYMIQQIILYNVNLLNDVSMKMIKEKIR